jgi:hypothetical protein
MALNKAQLMSVPGGPGIIGAVKAGDGISITPEGVISASVTGFPPGTTTVFGQASAPVGWTKSTTYDNYALRLVAGTGGGTGGQNAFTSAFASYTPAGNVTLNNVTVIGTISGSSLSIAQNASHTHQYKKPCGSGSSCIGPGPAGIPVGCDTPTDQSGQNQQHTHNFSQGTVQAQGAFVGTATSQFIVKYFDLILCVKT